MSNIDGPNVGDIKDVVRQAAGEELKAIDIVLNVLNQADEAIRLLTNATPHANDDRPGEAMARTNQAKVLLDEAIQEFRAAYKACMGYADYI